MPGIIDSFTGKYRFLSNFSPSRVEFEGDVYPTVEHAYQAAKTNDRHERKQIRNARTAGIAKRYGQRLKLKPNWDQRKVEIMRGLLIKKFQDPDLMAKLKATSPAILIEGNSWGDQFWGVSNGSGLNWLGVLLMQIRDG